jgi:hypothetical protein
MLGIAVPGDSFRRSSSALYLSLQPTCAKSAGLENVIERYRETLVSSSAEGAAGKRGSYEARQCALRSGPVPIIDEKPNYDD